MNVIIDARAAIWYRGTGIGTYTYQLIRKLLRHDHLNSYSLLLPGDRVVPAGPGTAELLSHAGVKRPGFWEALSTPNLAAGRDETVMIVPQNGIGSPEARRGTRLMVTIHDLIPFILPQTCSRAFLRRASAELPRIVENSDLVLTVSYHSKRDLVEILRVPEERIVVIHEAPEEMYRPLDRTAAKELLRARYGIDGPFILNIGGFSFRKNLTGLIAAFADLAARTTLPHRLVLVGRPGGGAYELCRELGERLKIADRVIYPGFVAGEDLPYLYNAADLFVFPSFYEGFGLPPLEAMACATPTITSDASSIPEVVGRGALLVDPYDPDALSRAMGAVLSDRDYARTLAEQGRLRAASFSWDRTAIKTMFCLEKLQFVA